MSSPLVFDIESLSGDAFQSMPTPIKDELVGKLKDGKTYNSLDVMDSVPHDGKIVFTGVHTEDEERITTRHMVIFKKGDDGVFRALEYTPKILGRCSTEDEIMQELHRLNTEGPTESEKAERLAWRASL